MKELTIKELRELIVQTEYLLQSCEALLIETRKQLNALAKPRTITVKTERE